MNIDQDEITGGWRWFFAAGLFAVCFALGLYAVDQGLTHSDKEARLGKTLREIRTAQHTVAGPATDVRMNVELTSKSDEISESSDDHSEEHH